MNKTRTRTLTGIVLAALLIPLLFVPSPWFYGAVGLFSLIVATEMFMMQRQKTPLPWVLLIYPLASTAGLYAVLLCAMLGLFGAGAVMLWLFSTVLAGGMLAVFVKAFSPRDFGASLLAIAYVGSTFAALAGVFAYDVLALVYVLIVAMMTDIFAYFIGIRFGKHRLAPAISPKKSIEGAVAGTVIAVCAATIYAHVVGVFPLTPSIQALLLMVAVGIFVSVFAQIGDLVASRFKREYGIKDFSKLLPGHGGLLDRFDSSIFAALAMAMVLLGMGVIG